jgi:hypothetical protein
MLTLPPHHRQSIANVTRHFTADPEVLALLLGGSLAHGFASPTSDVDVMIIVSDETYAERLRAGQVHFFSRDLCPYPEGYVDGKYLSRSFLARVEQQGSEPARFAFQDAQILFSRLTGLEQALRTIARYPGEAKAQRISRFYAQLEAWYWYAGEALKSGNRYLLNLSASKLVLFGGRLLLAHNERLYPYHKWFLRVLEEAPDKPAGLREHIDAVLDAPCRETLDQFYVTIKNFRVWDGSTANWPTQFMLDSEWNWQDGPPPIDDL